MTDPNKTTTVPVDVLKAVIRNVYESERRDMLQPFLPDPKEEIIAEAVEEMASAAWLSSDDYLKNGAHWEGVAGRAQEEYRMEMRNALEALLDHRSLLSRLMGISR